MANYKVLFKSPDSPLIKQEVRSKKSDKTVYQTQT